VLTARPVKRGGGGGESFPRPRDIWGALPSFKNIEKDVPDGFFLSSNMHKIHFRPGLHPGLSPGLRTGGVYDAPQTPGRMVRGHHSPCFLPLDAFGVSISAHTE